MVTSVVVGSKSRQVACPHCGHVRETKAARGMRLRCPGCAGGYRAPGDVDDLPTAEVTDVAPAGPQPDPVPPIEPVDPGPGSLLATAVVDEAPAPVVDLEEARRDTQTKAGAAGGKRTAAKWREKRR